MKEVKKGVRLVFMKTRTEPHRENLKDDYNKVADRALEIKKMEAVDKWFKSKIPTFHLVIDPQFAGCNQLGIWMQSITKNQ